MDHYRSRAERQQLRLLYSYGGKIAPCLCNGNRPAMSQHHHWYIGGENRLVIVSRHISLPDLYLRLSKTFLHLLQGSSFALKYKLPDQALDSPMISVGADKDLRIMIKEYDRTSRRIRVFLLPLEPDLNSLLDVLGELLTSIPRKILSELPSMNSILGVEDGQKRSSVTGEFGEDQSSVVAGEFEEDGENTIDKYDGISTISRSTASTRIRMLRFLSRSNSLASIESGTTNMSDIDYWYFNRPKCCYYSSTFYSHKFLLGQIVHEKPC